MRKQPEENPVFLALKVKARLQRSKQKPCSEAVLAIIPDQLLILTERVAQFSTVETDPAEAA
jgi:hypothetical protein